MEILTEAIEVHLITKVMIMMVMVELETDVSENRDYGCHESYYGRNRGC